MNPFNCRRASRSRSAVVLFALTAVASVAGEAFGHGESPPPPPPPPMAPRMAGNAANAVLAQARPERWSWLHWWEANRDPYLSAPGQPSAEQAADPKQIEVLRERAVQALTDLVKQGEREDVVAEAVLSLGKMRHAEALPLLKEQVEKTRWPQVRSHALLAIGLIGTDEARGVLAEYPARRTEDAVATMVAWGLSGEPAAGQTLLKLRQGVFDAAAPVATSVTWALRQHAYPDGWNFYRTVLEQSSSPWVAGEALVAAGAYPDATPLLIDVLFREVTPANAPNAGGFIGRSRAIGPGDVRSGRLGGQPLDPRGNGVTRDRLNGAQELRSSPGGVLAWDVLEQMHLAKLQAVAEARGAAKNYESGYEGYKKYYEQYYANNPNKPPLEGKQTVKTVSMVVGEELIQLGVLRSSAAIALGNVGRDEARDALVKFLSDAGTRQEEYRLTPQEFAVMSLARYPSDAVRDRLVALLGRRDGRRFVVDVPKDSPLRGFAALALGIYARPYETEQGQADRVGYDAAVAALVGRVEDATEEMEVRAACAVGLGLSRRTAVVPPLVRLAQQLEVRPKTTEALLYGYVMLGRALAGDQNVVAPAQKFVLERREDASTSGLLAKRAAILSLGVSRKSEAIPGLTKAWHLTYYPNREAIVAMRLIGAQHLAGLVLDELKKARDPRDKVYLTEAVGELLAAEQPTPLKRVINGSNYTERNDTLLPAQRLGNEFLFWHLIPLLGGQWQ